MVMKDGDLTEDGLTGIAILDFDLRRLPVEERPAAARRALEAFRSRFPTGPSTDKEEERDG